MLRAIVKHSPPCQADFGLTILTSPGRIRGRPVGAGISRCGFGGSPCAAFSPVAILAITRASALSYDSNKARELAAKLARARPRSDCGHL